MCLGFRCSQKGMSGCIEFFQGNLLSGHRSSSRGPPAFHGIEFNAARQHGFTGHDPAQLGDNLGEDSRPVAGRPLAEQPHGRVPRRIAATHALLSGSTAINAGDPAFVPPPVNDQRGAPLCPRLACKIIVANHFSFRHNIPTCLVSGRWELIPDYS